MSEQRLDKFCSVALSLGRASRVGQQAFGFYHHGCTLQCVVPASPTEPHDALSGSEVLRVVQVEAVQTSAAGLPPPSSLEHGRAIQRRSVIIPVVCREGAVVGAVPGVVERVTSVALVTINLQLVVFRFRVNLEVRILCVPVSKIHCYHKCLMIF